MKNDEQSAISTLINDLLYEKRKDRWLAIIRFILWFALVAFVVSQIFSSELGASRLAKTHVAVVRLDGMIASGHEFSADQVIPTLQTVFADSNVSGVIININSPGGTPVQASIIHDEIVRLKQKHHKKVVVVGEDLLTSGAYFVAVAADKIYVNPNTLTGSIGVIMKGFGFVDAMKKLGVERRVYYAGNDKDRLDPFLPQNSDDVKKISGVMQEVHDNFKNAVMNGRKGKLKATPEQLFNGDFWSGQTALKLGLVDGLGSWITVLQKEFQSQQFHEYTLGNSFLKMLSSQMTSTFDHLVYS